MLYYITLYSIMLSAEGGRGLFEGARRGADGEGAGGRGGPNGI